MKCSRQLSRNGLTALGGVLLGLLFMTGPLQAQVTPSYSYSGATGGNWIPFGMHISSSWQKWQGFYEPNLFTGAYAGNITKVYFQRSSASSGTTYSNFGVYLGQSTSQNFPTNQFYTPMTQALYASSYTIPAGAAGEWFVINLTTPVYYNPNQTLIVQICASGITSGTGFPTRDGGSHTIPNVGRIYGGGSGCATATPSGSTTSYRKNFGFDLNPALPDDAGISELVSPVAFCAGTHDVKVNLFNYGTNTLNSVQIDWTWNGVPQTPITWNTPLATITDATVTLGTKTMQGGVPYTLQAWTSNPNNTNDSFPANDTLTSTLVASLDGVFTIGGTNPDYTTFAAAVSDLNTYGVCGPVVFNVRPGTYNEQISLGNIVGTSAINTVTFQSETNNTPDVNLTFQSSSWNSNYVLELNGAKFVTFKDMTMTATSSSYGRVVYLTGSSTDDTFDNCELVSPNSNSTSTYMTVVYSDYGSLNHRVTFKDCGIREGSYGMYMYGAGTGSKEEDVTIQNCEFTGQYYNAFYGYYMDRLKFHDNYLEKSSPVYTYSYYLMYLYYNEDFSVERNVYFSDDDAYYRYLVYTYQAQGSENRFVNNFIMLTHNQPSTYGIGLYAYYGNNLLVAHNTFYMNSTNINTRSIMQYYGSNQQYYNNIFYSAGPSMTNWIYTPTAVVASDYNLYYGTANILGVWGTSAAQAYNNLAGLQAASGMEGNSVSKTVSFAAPLLGDLHLVYPSEDDTDLFGTLLNNVTDDIDHEARIQPYMGADEACYIEAGSVTYDFVDGSGQPAAYAEAPGSVGVHYRVAFPEFAINLVMTVSFYDPFTNQLVYQTTLTDTKQYGVTLDNTQYITIPATVPPGAYKVEVNFWTKNSCGEYRDYIPYPSALLIVPEGRIPCVVWPGDVNNDGVVNYTDRRALNLYIYNANLRTSWLNGPARYQADAESNPFTYLEWKPQAAAPWQTPEGCYMDTDGNGVVNNMDYIAMKLNWSKMTPWYGGSPKADYSGAPSSFMMDQNYPNPFNPSTTIRYHASEASHVLLVVTDALGRKVAELQDGRVESGMHEVQFDASNLPSGTYIATITMTGTESGATFSKTIKMALNK